MEEEVENEKEDNDDEEDDLGDYDLSKYLKESEG